MVAKEEEMKRRLEEYKMCQIVLNQENNLYWTRFNILFAVEIFLFSVFAFLIRETLSLNQTTEFFSKIDPWIFYVVIIFFILIGLGTTIVWYITTEKSSAITRYFADRMFRLEQELLPIDKQTLMNDIFYNTSNIGVEDKRYPYVTTFKDKLRWPQKKSITGTVRFLVLGFLLIWVSLIPIVIHILIDKWYITGPLFELIIILFVFFITLTQSKSKKKITRDKIKNSFKKKAS
ncbi:MAG: hypothetical protein K9W42_12325 [Candidatus Heimdallarchaeota archaeon]|nr:hypothetical protein [Candidatus Heimdallarchaeota archaeon]